MTNNFDEFHINIPNGLIEDLVKECIITSMKKSSNGESIDINTLVTKVVAINFTITHEILRQYHSWQLDH